MSNGRKVFEDNGFLFLYELYESYNVTFTDKQIWCTSHDFLKRPISLNCSELIWRFSLFSVTFCFLNLVCLIQIVASYKIFWSVGER